MKQNHEFLSHLNPSQNLAVKHFCGPMLVVAGAGSGKTRALTYRIAHLILNHQVNPENILAVTFTNKAAREMKERIEHIFANLMAQEKYSKPLDLLPESDQKQLLSRVYKTITKPLWIGTFHRICVRILRYDIDKYQDEKKRVWKKNFSIIDESDAQSIVKNIVTKKLNLDDKKFEPRSVRYQISNAKNKGLYPQQLAAENNNNYKGRILAEVYEEYQAQLAANNCLDFDDLILIPVRLLQENESLLSYWHSQFHHILVDEYQDTNYTQYQLIRLLSTNGENQKELWNWQNRSLFVVGDADQSIYSFRMADFTILLNFQQDFGDNLPYEDTRTIIKLEENYRSRENILALANNLIKNNIQRIEKVLKPTKTWGEEIYWYQGENEEDEARFIVNKIQQLMRENPELDEGSFAVLYRINTQSRPIEDELIKTNTLYKIVGGLKFYDRKEIKDALAYLRVIVNPDDTVSLLRIINTPRRGIGKTTINSLLEAARELNMPLWEIIKDETSVNTIAGRAAKKVNKFAQIIQECQEKLETASAVDIFHQIMDSSNYIEDLQKQGTDEAENRLENINELLNTIVLFHENNEENSLEEYLISISLNSDLDNLNENEKAVSLMTLHSAKGLEFKIVFMVGLEQGILPHYRSLKDDFTIEEERRLCYVGITRAQERLFLSHAKERFLWGSRDITQPSQFAKEFPEDLITTNGNSFTKKTRSKDTQTQNTNVQVQQTSNGSKSRPVINETISKRNINQTNLSQDFAVGDRILHKSFGEGEITHIFKSNKKTHIAIKFSTGQKIVDPKLAPIEKISST